MIFVMYDSDRKGYWCIETKTRKLCISRDVIFHEMNDTGKMIIDSDDDGEEIVNGNPVLNESISTVTASDNDDNNTAIEYSYQFQG